MYIYYLLSKNSFTNQVITHLRRKDGKMKMLEDLEELSLFIVPFDLILLFWVRENYFLLYLSKSST